MTVANFIARRLSISSAGNKMSPAVAVGIAAVALAITVMACAIAIVGGFKREITNKVAGFNSHITITPMIEAEDATKEFYTSEGNATSREPSNLLTLTPTLKSILDSRPYVTDYSLQAAVPAIFKTSSDFKGSYLKSLTGKDNLNFVESSMVSGKIPDYTKDEAHNDILISASIASDLGLKTGDRIDTYFITDKILVRKLRIAGIFNSHFEIFDDTYAFGSLPLVQELGNVSPTQATSIVVSTDNFSNIDQYAEDLTATLLNAYAEQRIYRLYNVTSARQSGMGYFHWLDMLDTNVIVVLTLMTIVAVITLISGMLILMVDKVRVIALLAALGASRQLISRIFIRLAAKIALIGLLIGDAISLCLLYAQKETHFMPLDPDSYYIDFVPVEISVPAILVLNIAIIAIIWVALILPSRFAGKVAPARTLARE